MKITISPHVYETWNTYNCWANDFEYLDSWPSYLVDKNNEIICANYNMYEELTITAKSKAHYHFFLLKQ